MNQDRIDRCFRRLYRALDSMELLSADGIEDAQKVARDGLFEGYAWGDYCRYCCIARSEKRFRTAVKHLEKLIREE